MNKLYAIGSLVVIIVSGSVFFNAKLNNTSVLPSKSLSPSVNLNASVIRPVIKFDLVNSSIIFAASRRTSLIRRFNQYTRYHDILKILPSYINSVNEINPQNFHDFINSLSDIQAYDLQQMINDLMQLMLGDNFTQTFEMYDENGSIHENGAYTYGSEGVTVQLEVNELKGGGYIYTARYTEDGGKTSNFTFVGEDDDESTALKRFADAIAEVLDSKQKNKEVKQRLDSEEEEDSSESEENKIIYETERHMLSPFINQLYNNAYFMKNGKLSGSDFLMIKNLLKLF